MYINVDEVIFRQRLADAQMALVRAAARARLHYVRHGNLPTSREELADLFETDPPRDPFAPKLTISCKATSVGCVVYSLGPDGTEQNATVEFSSSDNMTDPGDVCLHVHREPIYPFPPGGVRASTALDVLRSFPHGLPNDPFGPNRSSPLSILDATTTTPIVVFSVGPQKAPPAGAHGRLQKPADEQSPARLPPRLHRTRPARLLHPPTHLRPHQRTNQQRQSLHRDFPPLTSAPNNTRCNSRAWRRSAPGSGSREHAPWREVWRAEPSNSRTLRCVATQRQEFSDPPRPSPFFMETPAPL